MTNNFQGKMWLLAFIMFFIGWCLVSMHQEEKMRVRLELKEAELKQAQTERSAAMESLENAVRAKEQIHAEISKRKNGLEFSLDAAVDWSGIAIPDDIIRMLENSAGKTCNIFSSGNASGRCENPAKNRDQDCGRHGASDTGR